MAILSPRWVDGGVSMAERILAVDDEHLVLELIRRSLEAANYEVALAPDGSAALQVFHRVQPHLVVLDLMMPGMSGWEVCSRLRAFSTVPIIMLTALTAQEDIIKGLNAMIFEKVWSYDAEASQNSVKWYVWRLRNKIEKDPGDPHFIVTERGIGYRFTLL